MKNDSSKIVLTGVLLCAFAFGWHATPLFAATLTELGNGAVINNSTGDNALSIIQQTTVGKSRANSGAFLLDNSKNANTGLTLYTNMDDTAAQPLMRMEVDNTAWDEEILYIHSDSPTSRGLIRLDSPAPEIEFVETDQDGATGKFEVRVQHGEFQINSRRADDTTFEKKVTMTQDGDLQIHGGDIVLEGGCVRVGSSCLESSEFKAASNDDDDSARTATAPVSGEISAGEPRSVDCNSYTERGRMVFDYEQNRLYVCAGPERGWDYTELND